MYYINDFYYVSANPLMRGFAANNPGFGILFGGFITLIFICIYYGVRKILSFSEITDAVGQGIRSMVEPFIILCLAWTLSSLCCDLLSAGDYLSGVINARMSIEYLPLASFLVAAVLSFASGTSWGTYGISIPLIVKICGTIAPEYLLICLAAVLAGAVFGDHCSPISDTTILSSSSAMCNHDDHVKSQIPYAFLVAVCSAVGYLVLGKSQNIVAALIVSIGALIVAMFLLHRKFIKTEEKYKNTEYEL